MTNRHQLERHHCSPLTLSQPLLDYVVCSYYLLVNEEVLRIGRGFNRWL